MQCDFADLESVQNFCKNFLAKESALHILVNNAGELQSNLLDLLSAFMSVQSLRLINGEKK